MRNEIEGHSCTAVYAWFGCMSRLRYAKCEVYVGRGAVLQGGLGPGRFYVMYVHSVYPRGVWYIVIACVIAHRSSRFAIRVIEPVKPYTAANGVR